MAYRPLKCDLYDCIEITCMRHYDLDLELLDGHRFQATALTTRTSAEKEEFLQLETGTGTQEVRLDLILAITVLNEGADIARIELGNSSCSF